MNLLEKAKVITTPTAYSEGILHSVKPSVLENLLLQSNQFDTSWTISNASVTSGQSGYDGSSDAWLLTATTQPALIYQNISGTSTYSFSLYAKANTQNSVFIRLTGSVSGRAFFDLQNGVIIGPTNLVDSQIENIGNGWYRCTIVSSDTISDARMYVADNSQSFPSSGSIYIQDAQLNKGYSADQYIETTTETSPRADFTFTRNSSATRVGADGYIQDVQIIGGELVQNGDFEEIGSELITNGDFATDSDWSKGAGWTISGGLANHAGAGGTLIQSLILIIGKTYQISYKASGISGTLAFTGFSESLGQRTLLSGSNTIILTASSTSFGVFSSANATIDNVSVKEVGQNWVDNDGAVEFSLGQVRINSGINGTLNRLVQASFTIVGRKYRLSYEVLQNVGTTNFKLWDGSAFLDISNSVGIHTFDYTQAAVGSFILNNSDAASGKYIDITNISIKEVTDDTNIPRINYEGFQYDNGLPIYGSGKGHLLLEPQRTNLITESAVFSGYSGNNAVITDNATTSPDGALTGAILADDNAGGTSTVQIAKTITVDVSSTYTYSIFAKKKDLDFIALRLSNFTTPINNNSFFDLNLGTVVSAGSGIVAEIENYGNGWYRCSVTFTTDAADTSGTLQIRLSQGGTGTTVDLDNTSNIYIWGWQFEKGSYATSYIPTNGSAVTRLGETCTNAGNADLFDSEGVLYAEIAALADDLTFRYISLSDGTGDNCIRLYYTIASNSITYQVRFGGSLEVFNQIAITDIKKFNKIAVKYKQNNFSFWINGVEVATDTSGNTPIGLNVLQFSDANGSSSPFYGKTKMVAVFPYLSNDELECLTGEGYGSFEAMALANNYTIIQG
jgi:hypothetical protein